MMKIRITSDSTCDLSQELVQKYNVTITPLYVNMGDKPLRDQVDVQPDDIFEYYQRTGSLCFTSARNIGEYLEVFTQVREECDAVIHLSLGSSFSSSYQNAVLAASELENVYVVDSHNLTNGHGYLVIRAAEMVEQGLEPAAIVEELERLTDKLDVSFVLDQLEYLHKGGRCSSVAALGANLLKLKPCIEVVDGKMQVGKKYRGSFAKCVEQYIRDRLADREGFDLSRVFFASAGVDEDTLTLTRRMIRECVGEQSEIIESIAGCTVSCHCGPGALGVILVRK